MRSKRVWATLVLLTAACWAARLPGADGPEGLALPAWMAGSWSGVDGEVASEELWTAPKGGVMLGLHRDVGPAGAAFFEYLRIEERPGGLVYVAQPMGREPTEFTAVETTARQVVFENLEHDFPQRIIYRLDEEQRLVARIEGERDGRMRSSEWRWRRDE
jgi:hypothetical protein